MSQIIAKGEHVCACKESQLCWSVCGLSVVHRADQLGVMHVSAKTCRLHFTSQPARAVAVLALMWCHTG